MKLPPAAADAPQNDAADLRSDDRFLSIVGYIIVFCVCEAVAMSLLYAFARSGLQTSIPAILGQLSATIAVMAAWFIPLAYLRNRIRGQVAAALAMTLALLMPIAGFLVGLWVLVPIATVGAVGLWMAIAKARRLILTHPLALVLGAPAFALVRFVAINGGQMTHIYAPEFMLLGQPYLDTSFHAALTEMIRNYGAVSVGLDGLGSHVNHVGSHVWIGAFATIFGESAIDLFPMALQIFAVPCFSCFFMTSAAYLTRSNLRNPVALIVAGLLVTFVSSWFFLDKLLLSESYLYGLVLLFPAIPLLFTIMKREQTTTVEFLIYLIVAALLAIVMVAFKVPVGVMWAAAVAVAVIRRVTAPRWRVTIPAVLLLSAFGIAAVLFVVSAAFSIKLGDFVSPFDFAGSSRKYFLSDVAIGALIAIATGVSGIAGSYDRRDAAGLLGIFVFFGALPGAIFALGNTAYYFVNIAAWLALVVATAQLAVILESAIYRRQLFGAAAIALLIAVVIADPDRYKRLAIYLQRVAALQEYGTSGTVGEWPRKRSLAASFAIISDVGASIAGQALRFDPLFAGEVGQALARSPGGVFVQQVNEARASAPGRLAVFVPPTNYAFWNMTRDCRAQPFFIPAMTGVPMIMGLSPFHRSLQCVADATYGFGQYGYDSHSRQILDDALCSVTRNRGFDAVVILEFPKKPGGSRIVSCPP